MSDSRSEDRLSVSHNCEPWRLSSTNTQHYIARKPRLISTFMLSLTCRKGKGSGNGVVTQVALIVLLVLAGGLSLMHMSSRSQLRDLRIHHEALQEELTYTKNHLHHVEVRVHNALTVCGWWGFVGQPYDSKEQEDSSQQTSPTAGIHLNTSTRTPVSLAGCLLLCDCHHTQAQLANKEDEYHHLADEVHQYSAHHSIQELETLRTQVRQPVWPLRDTRHASGSLC